jgi:hypothetical protein
MTLRGARPARRAEGPHRRVNRVISFAPPRTHDIIGCPLGLGVWCLPS